MKKIILGAAVMFLMVSCQKDNSQEEVNAISKTEKENWLKADLNTEFASSQKQVTAYLFPTQELDKLVNTPNVEEVRFVLGYADNTIQIEVVGIDESGKKLGIVKSVVLKDISVQNNLVELKKLTVNTAKKRSLLLNEHILLPNYAFTWIDAWQEKLNTVSDLDEALSYEGTRFRYYSLEAAVVKEMTSKKSANVGLFLGLNQKGKVTTILVNLDKNNGIKKTSLTSKDTEDVYDATRPCPPNGDPDKP
ncbi:hypothetical protein [Flavobacterium sp. UBA7680]|uniref:hypothetical protein n=1 Tax=Flavobacterium sp. UBA7680 TaxID=1946559 RepID=UPI0025BCA7F5|nr:hypothetical protein [Flavobacterium sp. UBA7680]